jgi:hypothetical protein
MATMTKRDLTNAPKAVLEWHEKEERLRAEARDWAKARLEQIVFNDESYTPRTASEILAILDVASDQPSGYAFLNRSGQVEYNTRYAIVRNHLEALARAKRVVCGTTINKNGVAGSTTYVRPRDVTASWNIEVDGDATGTIDRIVREFLTQFGAILDHSKARAIFVTRKNQTGDVTAYAPTAEVHRGVSPNRRKPRTTRGGD